MNHETMASDTVRSKILIISDTHCAALTDGNGIAKAPFPPFQAPLPKADLLIHCE